MESGSPWAAFFFRVTVTYKGQKEKICKHFQPKTPVIDERNSSEREGEQAKATQQARERSHCWEGSQVSLPQIHSGFLITQLPWSHLNLHGFTKKNNGFKNPFKIILFMYLSSVCSLKHRHGGQRTTWGEHGVCPLLLLYEFW